MYRLFILVILGNLLLIDGKLTPHQRVKITDSIKKQKAITNGLELLISNPTGLDKLVDFSKKILDYGSTYVPALGAVYKGVGFVRELIGEGTDDPVMKELKGIREDFRRLDNKLDSLEQVIRP